MKWKKRGIIALLIAVGISITGCFPYRLKIPHLEKRENKIETEKGDLKEKFESEPEEKEEVNTNRWTTSDGMFEFTFPEYWIEYEEEYEEELGGLSMGSPTDDYTFHAFTYYGPDYEDYVTPSYMYSYFIRVVEEDFESWREEQKMDVVTKNGLTITSSIYSSSDDDMEITYGYYLVEVTEDPDYYVIIQADSWSEDWEEYESELKDIIESAKCLKTLENREGELEM